MKAQILKLNLIIAILFTFNSYSQVVLNEIMVRPPGTVSTPPNGLIYVDSQEYIEIYNNSCSSMNISGYFIAMKQNLSSINTGGTFRIPNIPAANIPAGGHVVIGSSSAAGSAAGNIDIPITAADRCLYNGNFVLANTDGWCALYNASGVAIDCVYWSSNISNLTSNTSDFNPPGGICLPSGSPAVTLQTPFQINGTTPSIVRYGGPNPSAGNPLSRQQDGANTWVQNLASSIAANNCNGGTCVTPSSAPSAPSVTTPVNYCQGATAVPLTATPSAGGTLNWYGTSATGGTASPTAPTPSTATVGSTTYYVSQTVGGCESPRAAVVVNVNTSWSSIISCGTSTASSVTFDWTFANFATGYSISYQVNSGSPINIGSIGNVLTYTVNSLNSGDNVTITVTPLGGSVNCFTSTTSSCATIINNSCGVCNSPSCPIIGVANYSLRNFSAGTCSTWSPSLTNSVVKNYYLVQADANGFVGLIQQANGSPALCISRSAILRPLATSCNVASNVSPSVVNANGVASGFNPEWYGLTPNAQYIIEVTIILGVGCTLDSLCSNYYGCTIPSAPTASATIQPTCTTPTGTIVVSSPTGVGNLYSIDGINFQPSPTFSGLAPNTYTVIVKKTPSGCTSSATNITINAVPTITAPTASATAQPTCTVGTGTIVVSSPIGANFEYSINGTTFQTSPTFSGLTPNTYNVIVKNLTTGCISIATIVTINSQPATPNVPTILSVAPTCLASGSSSISNYVTGITYVFNPAGPSVAVGGAISGMVTGTNYAVSASNGSCTSSASASFSNVAQLTVPATPTILSVAPTCLASESSSISNYVAGITYVFNPAGPSVAVGGAISGMVTGTNYTVSASNGSCTSSASASFSNVAQLTVPATPTILSVAPTCLAAGSSSISNYVTGITYVFNPSGPSVAVGGAISGMVTGTNYTVSASNGSCTSSASASFSNVAQLTVPATPTILSVAPTCLAAGSSSISNYVTGITYVFNPSGPSVAVGGAISGMVTGTNYTVSASNGSCTSSASASFSNVAQLTVPATPTILSVAPTCSSSGSSSISNYVAGITYVFNPAGPSVAVGGAISGMVTGTNYTVSASNGSCTSVASANIVINAQPVTPVLNYTVTNTFCNGSTLNFALNSNVTNTNFSWSATVSNISGFYSTTTNGDESNINNLVALTNPEAIGTITMVIIPRANGCDGIPQTVVITVNPNPLVEVVAVADTSVCSATSATNNVQVNISGNISGITYNWTAITNGVTVVGGTISGTITATSTTASFGLQVITSNPLVAGTIYFEVSAVRNGCVGNTLQSAVVTVNPNPGVAISSPDKTICSGDPTDLMIDVSPLIAGTEIEWEVLTVVNVSGANPGSGIAPQPINDVLASTTGGYVIYRVRTSLGECAGSYTDYRVNVNPAPLPILTDGNICITADGEVYQNYTLNTGLNNTDYDFEWFDSNGNIIPGETNATLVVDAPGTYSVIATNWLTGCSSDPLLARATATVTETLPATSMTVIQSEYFSDNATITVNVTGGTGTFMYSLDGGLLQSSNVFTGVSAGEHLVTVVDTEGCTYLTQEVTIIDYPNYFTPNGDGINDTWNIIGLNQPGAKLYIFDRYGKLLKQLSATDNSNGWDGMYNQEQLPSTDYWFTLDYTENGAVKQFKSHFSLKR